MAEFKKIILLLVYNRPDKTEKVVSNLKKVHRVEECELVVVRQDGNEEVKEIIDSIDWITTHHIVTKYDNDKTVKYKINQNMRLGISKSFEEFFADYILIIEDDLLLGFDIIDFCDVVHSKYYNKRKFRAINAFSGEEYNEKLKFSYGKFRYGVGKGWSINKKLWKRLKKKWKSNINQHFDHLIEPWIRTGYVIMPYCSRSYDIGWGVGYHTPESEHDEYYTKMKKSWVKDEDFSIKDYDFSNNLEYHWREDCYRYKFFCWNSFRDKFNIHKLREMLYKNKKIKTMIQRVTRSKKRNN